MAGFRSQIAPTELVINDQNYQTVVTDPVINGDQKSRGLIPRDWSDEPFGSLPFAEPLPDSMLIPENEWVDRISEMESSKTRLTDLCDQDGLTVLDQNGTNYCWINAPVHCVEVIRTVAGQQLVRLSPASCGAIIKNYRNVGGWGTEGLKFLVSTGAVPQSSWPPNAIQRSYDTAESRELRKQYKVTEWWDLRARNINHLMSCLLQRIPVALGYNWWSHEVTGMDGVVVRADPTPVAAILHEMAKNRIGEYSAMKPTELDDLAELSATYGIRIDNSWGQGWSERGRGILNGSKMLPDDAVAPRVATPS